MENLIFYEFVCNELIIVIIKLCAIIYKKNILKLILSTLVYLDH